jgi:hypothetical protein
LNWSTARVGKTLAAFVGVTAGTWAFIRLIIYLVVDPGPYLWDMFLLEAIVYVVPVGLGYVAARRHWLKSSIADDGMTRQDPGTGRDRPLLARRWVWMSRLLLLAYAVTWAFGAPAIQGDIQRDVEAQYNAIAQRDASLVSAHGPWSSYAFAAPLAPGVVLSYQSFSSGGKCFWSGWMIHLWYVKGVRPLYQSARVIG